MLCGMRVDRPVTGIAIGYGESNPARTFVIARWHSACDRLAYVAARAPVLVSGLVKAQARGRNSNKGATLRLGLRPEGVAPFGGSPAGVRRHAVLRSTGDR